MFFQQRANFKWKREFCHTFQLLASFPGIHKMGAWRRMPGIHCSHIYYDIMQNCCFQVCDGDMPLLPFQSGCERQIRTKREELIYVLQWTCHIPQ